MPIDYVLYGADHSLYTGKVRAYMRYKGLDWEERTATRDVYKTILIPRVGIPIVPVLETAAGDYVQDSTDIIDFIEARHPDAAVYPETPVQRLVALLLELYGDEWLIIPAMHYRWSVLDQQREFVLSEFGKMSMPGATLEEQVAIGERTSRAFSAMVPALGINEQTIPGIEAAYLTFLDQLDRHLARFEFLLGSRPSIGDYGFMGPLYAHLGRDPVPLALMQQRAPHVYAWVCRMNDPVPRSGAFLADDGIPETLLPILSTMFTDQLADVLDVIAHNSAWLEASPGGSIPRFLGMHPFTTGTATGERVVSSFSQWMFQRAWLHYHSLGAVDRAAADRLLERVGGISAMNVDIRHWVTRRAGQLELVAGPRTHSMT